MKQAIIKYPRSLFLVACLFATLLVIAPARSKKNKKASLFPVPITVNTAKISFSVIPQKKYGSLKWLGGLNLSSGHEHFGGFSGVSISADGTKILAVTDRGYWLRGDLVYNNRKLVGMKNTVMGILLSKGGQKLRRKRYQDAETIALLSGTLTNGHALIGFERLQRIGKFRINNGNLSTPHHYIYLPKNLKASKRNKGIEALAILKAGRYKGAVVVIPERLKNRKGNLKGWILTKTGSHRITLKRRGGFDVTDMAAMPDGSLLILERRFRKPKGFLGMLSNNIIKMRIRHIAEKDLRPGNLLDGKILLEANRRYRIDNMEGLATHTADNGDQIITIMSDDNFSSFQDTLLLQFILPKN